MTEEIVKVCELHGGLIAEQCNIDNGSFRCRECLLQYKKQWYIKNKNRHSLKCKEYYRENKDKIDIINKKWKDNNKERVAKNKKDYRIKNKEYLYNLTKLWRQKNKEKRKVDSKNRSESSREKLDDNYVKSTLTSRSNLQFKDIPNELIEIQRLRLQIKREIKNVAKNPS